jgi:phage terminase large subunit-like protein
VDLAAIERGRLDDLARELEAEKTRRHAENALAYYRPYAKQMSFHEAGARARERLFMAGNQLGKTVAGGFEVAMHVTGRYPDWWTGRRFDRPTVGWVASNTGETTRDNPQRILMGRSGQHGTGSIPKESLGEIVTARGVPDLLDMVRVKHVSGGDSAIGFKTYEKGREKWQGETLDWLWFDEEPPIDVYTEGLTRTNVASGPVWITFTPLLGMSETVSRFMGEQSLDREVITMTIDDAEHYTPEQRASIIASYPVHEREARAKGIPMLGSGRIFPVPEETITCERREIPRYWPRIGAMDFGWDHPFAAVDLAWDRDTDTVYVTKSYRVRQATPIMHAAALRSWGESLPWAWPHDGHNQTLAGGGIPLAKQYETNGLNMLPEHATFEDGGNAVEAGLMDMLDRMQSGRLKVFKDLHDWFEEFRTYHRKDGKVVKERDDIMSATRYGMMMLRYAEIVRDRYSRLVLDAGEGRGGNSSWMAT